MTGAFRETGEYLKYLHRDQHHAIFRSVVIVRVALVGSRINTIGGTIHWNRTPITAVYAYVLRCLGVSVEKLPFLIGIVLVILQKKSIRRRNRNRRVAEVVVVDPVVVAPVVVVPEEEVVAVLVEEEAVVAVREVVVDPVVAVREVVVVPVEAEVVVVAEVVPATRRNRGRTRRNTLEYSV